MGDYGEDIFVKCPFYVEFQRDKYRIKCEGPVKNTTIQLSFAGSKQWYIKEYCCKKYSQCLINQMLNQKYAKPK